MRILLFDRGGFWVSKSTFVGFGMETIEKETQNNHIGEFDIPALMNTVANNAWFGISPTKICISAGDDVIKLEGYTYEPFYEDFSSTSSILFNDEVLYGLDSRNVAAYRNEVYNKGKFNTLDEAVAHIKAQIKGKELVLLTEPQKLNEKIKSAIDKTKQNVSQVGMCKSDFVLD